MEREGCKPRTSGGDRQIVRGAGANLLTMTMGNQGNWRRHFGQAKRKAATLTAWRSANTGRGPTELGEVMAGQGLESE